MALQQSISFTLHSERAGGIEGKGLLVAAWSDGNGDHTEVVGEARVPNLMQGPFTEPASRSGKGAEQRGLVTFSQPWLGDRAMQSRFHPEP